MSMNAQATPNAFSVDLEDWFQGLTSTNPSVDRWPSLESRVAPATRRLLKLLRKYDVKATFFVLGYVANERPGLIREIRDDGHEIASHGYYHRFVYKLTQQEFYQDLVMTSDAIERATGERPTGFRAPYFSVNDSTPWAFDTIAAAGMDYDASVFPTRNMLYGWPGAPRFPYIVQHAGIMEYPASTIRFGGLPVPVSGGFYMRVLPYSLVQRALRSLNNQGQPAIMYLHPWELDVDQDYPHVTARERITHYYGRSGLEAKLHKLFTDFRFTTIGNLYTCEAAGDLRAPAIYCADRPGPKSVPAKSASLGSLP